MKANFSYQNEKSFTGGGAIAPPLTLLESSKSATAADCKSVSFGSSGVGTHLSNHNKIRLPFADNKIKSVLKGDLMDGRRKVSNKRRRVDR